MEQMLNEIIDKKGYEYVSKNLNDIINYLWFMEQTEGLEYYISNYCNETNDLIKASNKEQFNYIISLLGKKLNLDNEIDVLKYIYNKSGFIVHSTRENIYESLKENGLNGNDKPFDMEELNYVENLLSKKYNQYISLFGWLMIDKKFDKDNYWFYDKTAKNAIYYSNGPEWFNQFCGNAYADTIDEKHALKYRDKECAKNNLIKYLTRIKVEQNDINLILNIFEKYWEKYANSKQVMLLINEKEVLDIDPFDEYITDFITDGKLNIEELRKDMYYLIFADDINKFSDISIPFDKITKIDISRLTPSKKIKITPLEEEIVEEEPVIYQDEYRHFELICNIFKEILTQYISSIPKNLHKKMVENTYLIDIINNFIDKANIITNNLNENILINMDNNEISKDNISSSINKILDNLSIDNNSLMNILYETYNYVFNSENILTQIKLSKLLGMPCKYNEDFIIHGYISNINEKLYLKDNKYINCATAHKAEKFIRSKYDIDVKKIGNIINEYKEKNNLSDNDIQLIFVDLYDILNKSLNYNSNEDLKEFCDNLCDIKKKSLHI